MKNILNATIVRNLMTHVSEKFHKKHKKMQSQIRRINLWITSTRKTVELTKSFANAKCRQ
jgi:hypothetical protein